jgi:hypothetical protein
MVYTWIREGHLASTREGWRVYVDGAEAIALEARIFQKATRRASVSQHTKS